MNWKDNLNGQNKRPELITSTRGDQTYTSTVTQGIRIDHLKSLCTMTLAKNIKTKEIELLECIIQPDAYEENGEMIIPAKYNITGEELQKIMQDASDVEADIKPVDHSTLGSHSLADPDE